MVVGVPSGRRVDRVCGHGLADVGRTQCDRRPGGERRVCDGACRRNIAITLRLHLWFTSRSYPAELGWARARATGWRLVSDAILALGLVVAGVLVGDARPALAVIEIAVGVGAATAFAVIEPATTRAAFGQADRL
jgi:hypothetical protein